MVGIYDWFGYDVDIKERYKLIKDAGFDSVMLWWSDGFGRGEGYQKGVQYARNAGLFIENIHTPVIKQDYLSMDNLDGKDAIACYLQCIKDCFANQIPTMVIHAPNDQYPLNDLGLERIKRLADNARSYCVNIAFENLNNIHNLERILKSTENRRIGFCYDSCHHANYAENEDLLGRYALRLLALHLHDNGGEKNQHQLPFDGNIEWRREMEKIKSTGYQGSTTLEPMNWGYEDLTIQEFLSNAYRKAKLLDDARK